MDDRRLLTVTEAATMLGLGRSKIFALIAEGRLRSVRIDHSRRITRQALDEFIASLEQEALNA